MSRNNKMKTGYVALGLQTLAIVGVALRSWPFAKELSNSENWQGPLLPDKAAPFISIIVPARNEELNIERCVSSLLAQDYPNFEIIAVNDGSQDRTGQILDELAAQDARLKVLHLDGALPDGWAGKPHAMYEGEKAINPQSQWLLFTDADTKHNPGALRRAISEAIYQKADLFSVISEIEMNSFWEKLLMPIAGLGISFQYPFDKVNSPDSKLAIANGQFLLVRCETYNSVGGFGSEKLRKSLLDDRDMAIAVKSAGGRLHVRNGSSLLSVRMYRNFGEIWAGWRKNAFVGSRAAYVSVPFFIVGMLVGGVFPFLQLLYAMLKWGRSGGKQNRALLAISLLQVFTMIYSRWRFDRELGLPLRYSILNPLGMLVFAGILLDSMWCSLTGKGLSWKGRAYQNAAKSQQLI